MRSSGSERISSAEEQQICAMIAKEENPAYSSFLAEKTAGLRALVMVDDNEHLLAYSGDRLLPWDTEVLQMATARLGYLWSLGDYPTQRQRLSKLLEASVKRWMYEQVEFVSTRIKCENLAIIHAAEDQGFRVIESYLTFRLDSPRNTDVATMDKRLRLAHSSEVQVVSQLAYEAFHYNRYMMDPLVPEQRARNSRLVWVKNAFNGRAEAIYVAEVEQGIVGFVILRTVADKKEEKIGLIDLIAVDPNFAGRGIGSALVAQSLYHFRDKVHVVEVGTQAANVAGVNLYKKMGFRFIDSEYSLHWHSGFQNNENAERCR